MVHAKHLSPLLFCFIIGKTCAATVPPELTYLGKPIDALCFFNLEGHAKTINLQNCGLEKEKYHIKGEYDFLIKKGYIGYDWLDPNSGAEGNSYYKFFPAGNKQYWIYSANNGGGSGDFTEISLVKRLNTDTLGITRIDGGDRCNGGIQDVTEHNSQLTYSVNLTAYDFLALANDNPHHIKAYDDLSACAACCAAKVFYQLDTTLKAKFMYVDLGSEKDPANMSEQGTYHACFNQLFASYVTKNKTKLNAAQLKEFVHEFNAKCVKT